MADYINKKEFYDELVEYKNQCAVADDNGETRPKIPDSITMKFFMLCKGIASRPNFSGYTYIDEMILDGLENCIIAVHCFNPNVSNNPYGYFTKCIWFSFLRRIEKEKKQTYIKYKAYENFIVESSLNEEYDAFSSIDITNEKMRPILEKYDKKPKKKKPKGLEKFIDEEV